MYRTLLQSTLLYVLLCATFPAAHAFERTSCAKIIANKVHDGTISSNGTCFPGDHFFDLKNLVIDASCCSKYCGRWPSWYDDTFVRLNTWIIPSLILASNMHASALGRHKFFAIIHLFGDPVDTLWSLLETLSTWTQLASPTILPEGSLASSLYHRGVSRSVLGTLLGALEEIMAPVVDSRLAGARDAVDVFEELLGIADPDAVPFPELRTLLERYADQLAHSRTNDITRTALTIALYFWLVISNFFTVLSGNEASAAGRVATALFISWLLPIVLLSNLMGSFVSHTTCLAAIRGLTGDARALRAQHATHPGAVSAAGGSGEKGSGAGDFDLCARLGYETPGTFWASQVWAGGLYTYRPHKRLFQLRSLGLFGLACLPLVIGAAGSIALVWFNVPNGLGCRGVMLLLFAATYAASGTATWAIAHFTNTARQQRRGFNLTAGKDVLVAASTLLLIVVSNAGLFNTCYCATGTFPGSGWQAVPINTTQAKEQNSQPRYMVIFLVCLALQVLVFVGVWVAQRKGLGLMRWEKHEKPEGSQSQAQGAAGLARARARAGVGAGPGGLRQRVLGWVGMKAA